MSSARSKAALQDGVAVKQEPPDDGDDDSEDEDDGWEYGGGGGNMAAAEELDVDEDFDDAATEEAQRKRALLEEERAAKRAKLESNPAEAKIDSRGAARAEAPPTAGADYSVNHQALPRAPDAGPSSSW